MGAAAGRGGEEEERGDCGLHGAPHLPALHRCLCHLLLQVRGQEGGGGEIPENQNVKSAFEGGFKPFDQKHFPQRLTWFSLKKLALFGHSEIKDDLIQLGFIEMLNVRVLLALKTFSRGSAVM